MQDLETKGWSIGGEPSGHILCLDKSRTGDAIVAGLQVLMCMVERDVKLSTLTDGYTPFPQTLVNVRLAQMSDPYDNAELVAIFEQAEQTLAGQGRLLIRKSGTEPVIRVMVECQDEALCQSLAQDIAAKVGEILG